MPETPLFGYVAFYNGRRTEVRAASLYAAKQAAVAAFRVPKSRESRVSVTLAERPDGSPVVHTAAD